MADLSTLANVKAYLAITTANQDALISQLIPRESRLIERWTGRIFPFVSNISKRLNGTGSARLTLPDAPVLSVSSVVIGVANVALSPNGVQSGYVFDENTVGLVNDIFPRGFQNVTVSWTAGWQATQTDFVPAGNVPVLTPTEGGRAVTVVGVAYAGGANLTQVANAPTVGQYTFSAGDFTFAAADSGNRVVMDYYYVPGPVEQACIEMVGLDLKQRDNIGITSKNLGGETISYSTKGMTDSVKEMLQPYKRMAPV